MNDTQKKTIGEMRAIGHGYKLIAETLGISINTIKSYCQRNGLAATKSSKVSNTDEPQNTCKLCKAVLPQLPKSKTKTFCSDECRIQWWSKHRNKSAGPSTIQKQCKQCGRSFRSQLSANRKFCSIMCFADWKVTRYDRRAV